MTDKPNYADQWPGFEVKCLKCGSTDVLLDNSLGFSAVSGGWGSVDLVCQGCKARVEIVES